MTVRLTKNSMSASLDKIKQSLVQLPNDAFKYWVNATPIRTGNARKSTRLQGNKIQANYPYAVPLDKGSSKQAPQGMTKPTEKFVEQQLRKIIRK